MQLFWYVVSHLLGLYIDLLKRVQKSNRRAIKFAIKMTEFQKDIKEYRLICKLSNPLLVITLVNIQTDEFYIQSYNDSTLPPTCKVTPTIQEVFVFVQTKARIFRIINPGEVLCAQYMGRFEKYITFTLHKQKIDIPSEQIIYLTILKKQLFKFIDRNRQQTLRVKELETKLGTLKMQNRMLKIQNTKMMKGKLAQINQGEQPLDNSIQNSESKVIDCDEVVPEIALETRREQNLKKFLKNRLSVMNEASGKQPDSSGSWNENVIEIYNSLNQGKKNEEISKMKGQKQKKIIKVGVERMDIESHRDGQLYNFQVSKDCPYISRFKVTSNSIEKDISTDSYQVYGSQPLSCHKMSFTLQLKKSKYGNLIVGIITSALKSNRSSSFIPNSICYDGYYGIVLNNGQQSEDAFRKLREGDTIKSVIDLDKMQIEWFINSDFAAGTSIPSSMKPPLFPYFQLFDKGDVIILNPNRYRLRSN